METGESNNISFSSEDLDFQNSENYHLSVEIQKEQLSFCLLDTTKLEYIFLKSIKANNPLEMVQLINNEEILKYNFFSSSVSYKNFPSAIIPNPLYDATKKEVYAGFAIGETKKIKTDIIHHDDSTLLYSVEENITNTLNQIQTEIKEKNSSTIAISSILDKYSGLKEKSCFVIKEKNKIEIIVIQDDQLILQNYFEVNSNTDILYFTLFCFEQLKMDPNKNELYLIGNIEKGDETHSLLYDYIRNISFGKISKNLSFSKELNQITKHQYFTLFSQILCV
ncbi:MAG: hypothetical protein CMP60_06700 [Flavobacteriales bacterium]|nr:hypothetical protein [Flavobacteriales bacterium]